MFDANTYLGLVLQETYRLERLIGEGGMGAVFEASHTRLHRRFAVKLLYPEVAAKPESFARFRREAEVTSAIGHPNIVEVIDFNQTKEGIPYIVMESLEGQDLSHRIAQKKLTLHDVTSILRQTASALEAAHQQGIIHRDLKPQNIFVCRSSLNEPHIKVLDFGISKVQGNQSAMTKTTVTMGTPWYMSPEQAEGRAAGVDARTDVFSLGAIVYEMLANRPPFDGDSIPSVLYKVARVDPPFLCDVNVAVPRNVALVVHKALKKRPDERYRSMAAFYNDFASAVGPYLHREAQLERLSVTPVSTPVLTAVSTAHTAPTVEQRRNDALRSETLESSAGWSVIQGQWTDPHLAKTTLSAMPIEVEGEETVPKHRVPLILAGLLVISLGIAGMYYGFEYRGDTRSATVTEKELSTKPKFLGATRGAFDDAQAISDPNEADTSATEHVARRKPNSKKREVPSVKQPKSVARPVEPPREPIASTAISSSPSLRSLIVETIPEGADVILDGKRQGVTPFKTTIPLERALIELHKRGYVSYRRIIPPGQNAQHISLTLKLPAPSKRAETNEARNAEEIQDRSASSSATAPESVRDDAIQSIGHLSLVARGDGHALKATVYADGKVLGHTPLYRMVLAPGVHELTIACDGYATVKELVTIKEFEHTEISLSLKKEEDNVVEPSPTESHESP